MMFSFGEVVCLIFGVIVYGDVGVMFDCVLIDSCMVGLGDLFVVLKGECFDVYDFFGDVVVCGVVVVFVVYVLVGVVMLMIVGGEMCVVFGVFVYGWWM